MQSLKEQLHAVLESHFIPTMSGKAVYILSIELHADGPEPYACFVFPEGERELTRKQKIGEYLLANSEDFVSMIAKHFLIEPFKEFEEFREQYEMTRANLEIGIAPGKFRPSKKDRRRILRAMFADFSALEMYRFALLRWMYGSDYSYIPQLDRVERVAVY